MTSNKSFRAVLYAGNLEFSAKSRESYNMSSVLNDDSNILSHRLNTDQSDDTKTVEIFTVPEDDLRLNQ